MKRCLILMMILGAVLTLSECGKSYEEDARKTVNQYFAAVKDADLDKAKTYCSPNVDNEFDFDDYKAGFQKQFEALNLSEKTKKQTEEFIDYCIRSSIESYEVGEAEKSEDWDDAYTDRFPLSLGISAILILRQGRQQPIRSCSSMSKTMKTNWKKFIPSREKMPLRRRLWETQWALFWER